MNKLKQILSVLVFVVLLALFPTIYLQRQNLVDWWSLRGYEPSAEIVELADNTTMTDYGRKLFYVHHPQVNGRDSFNQNCNAAEQTIVLGCYLTHKSIYIFGVQDPRLDGIEEVTAAHEMLHAAYDRLSSAEQARIDRLTDETYRNINDARIKSVIDSYAARDASVVPNELHSILGTEVSDLPTELEDYYSKYFKDRSKVVEYSKKYESVFTDQQKQIKNLSTQISALEKDLLKRRELIEAKESEIQAEAESLSQLKRERKIQEYNSLVPGYNAKVNQYTDLIEAYNADVKRLNKLIDEHNDLAVEQKKLNDAINSKQPTI